MTQPRHASDSRRRAGPEAWEEPANSSAMEAPIVVASNRGPVSFQRDHRGNLIPSRSAGGLVTALSGVFYRDEATWVAAAITDTDVEIARTGRAVHADAHRVRFVEIPSDRYERYYNEISNRVLWFVHHYLFDVPRTPRFGAETQEAWEAFVQANRAFAAELSKEAARDPVFLIQDYHLSLVPQMLRDLHPSARIVHFSHTPFAGANYLRILPVRFRESVIRGMAGADVIGFQSRGWAENFIMNVRNVPGMRALRNWRVASADGRVSTVQVLPVAVNAHPLRETASAPEARADREVIAAWRAEKKLLLRVDRMEPSKNILRGFLAYELFLHRHPEWQGKVTFLALLSPSRDKLPEYQEYGDDCLSEAARINEHLGRDDWSPIEVRVQEDYPFAVAAYGMYDVLLVNPVFDGMNLVAMEGPLVNRRHGALVLSRNAGAFGRIGRHALGVNPFDLQETADAILEGLEMPEPERARRARGMSRMVQAHTPAQWLAAQLEAVDHARSPARPGSEGRE